VDLKIIVRTVLSILLRCQVIRRLLGEQSPLVQFVDRPVRLWLTR
jgi:hypothetical protein